MAFARRQTSRRRVDVHICYRNEAGEICPPNEKQAIAHASPAEHIFFGGAAGGGKSRWLLVAMLTFAALTKGVECAIFRRRKVELEQSLIPQALAMLPREAISYNGQLGKLEFRHNHSIVWFRYCMRDQDVVLYQSANWKKLGIDEASHMTQHQVDYLSTRVRGNAAQIQVLLGSNPGGPGHGWLKRRFVRPAGQEVGNRPSPKPFEVWRPYPPVVDPTRYMSSRVFIPALYSDNQEMLRFDPRYLDRVLALGGAQSRQLAYGDWDSNDGMMFGPDWEAEHIVRESDSTLLSLGFTPQQILPWHVFPSRASRPWLPPPSATIFGSIDYGYGAPWSFHLHAILPGGHIRTFFEFYRAGVRDREQARLIRVAVERLMSPPAGGGCSMQRPQWLVYDPQMDNDRSEVGLTESIADVYRKEITEGINVELVAGAKSSKLSRIQRTKDALAPAPDGFPWWSVSEVCTELIRTLPEMPTDPDNPEEIDESAEDHAWEECGRFLERRPIPPRVNPYSEVDELDPISRAEQLGILQRRDNVATVTPLNVQNLTTR